METGAEVNPLSPLLWALGRVLEAAPHDRTAHDELLRAAAQAEREGDVGSALEALGVCARLSATPDEARSRLHRLAQQLTTAGRSAELLRALELFAAAGRDEPPPHADCAPEAWCDLSVPSVRATGDIAAALRIAQAQLQRGDADELAATLAQVVQHAPAEWQLAPVLRDLRRAGTPGIFLCTLPKSGSVYVQESLCAGLKKQMLDVGAGGLFPHQAIAMGCLEALRKQRAVYMIHAEPSRYNRIELSARLDRMLVQVRDPRQTLLSWAHFIPEVVRRLDPPQALHYGTPLELFERPFEAQLDWHIEHYLPEFVSWIQAWVDCALDPDFKTQILFVTTEQLARDPAAFFEGILDFYGIDPTLFDLPAPPTAGLQNVRSARSDDWRAELTPAQLARCSALIPRQLCARFGWPPA